MNKLELIQKIKQLDSISQDERAYLIELLNTTKKYGLVWEDKPEDVEEQLRTQLPVLREVVEKRIMSQVAPASGKQAHVQTTVPQIALDFGTNTAENTQATNQAPKNAVNHTIIEGDNLHALTALTFTHEAKIDVIYIDPPYNTGNKDFKYNDSFVDKEDGYRHSKWLSFMNKRLRIAKTLLSEKGVIFISIDDNEQAQLKLLCDEIFGEGNFVGEVAVVNNLKGRSDARFIATANEYLLIYKKNSFETYGIPAPDGYVEEYKLFDKIGKYRLLGLRKRGDNSLREDRPNLFYPIYYNSLTNDWSLDKDDFAESVEIIPKLSNGQEGNWRWGKDTLLKRRDEIVIQTVKKRNEYDVFQKDYLHKENDEIKRIKPKSFWSGTEFSSDAGTKSLKEILPDANFRSPKPIGLINCCLLQSTTKDSTILDFFAGSGTTLHAVMALNAEDGGNRQCILVTNNENNICEEVTYERNKRVIEGYTNAKGVWVEGLRGNNLRYYQSDFVEKGKTEVLKRALTQASTELLCLRENCYQDITLENGFEPKQVRIFKNDHDQIMVVVYHSRQQLQVFKSLINYIKGLDNCPKVKLYAFSSDKDSLAGDFEEVSDKIESIPLPEALYNAYMAAFRVLDLDSPKPSSATNNQSEEE